tara:strand:+ start:221 stop:595 length:375 start_codon:yes stop_codon:yes gene_type:complete
MVSPYAMQYLMDNLKFADNGGIHKFHHNKTLPSFGDSGGRKKYKNNFQRHFENLRSMGALPDNLKGDGGGRVQRGIGSVIPPSYGDSGGKYNPFLPIFGFGDSGGVFNRMESVPFHGPPRYTLN